MGPAVEEAVGDLYGVTQKAMCRRGVVNLPQSNNNF